MFRQLDFRSFFNFLGRNKLYTAINIFGLSLSLMFVILIADYTVRQLMMQAGMDSIADAGFHCNVCIVEDGASLLIYVLYAG